jgi:hypothetical protein
MGVLLSGYPIFSAAYGLPIKKLIVVIPKIENSVIVL